MQEQGRFIDKPESAAEGRPKSSVPGVSFDTRSGKWRVGSLQRWGVKSQSLAYAISQAAAEKIVATHFPRLVAAAAEGKLQEEIVAVRAELKAQVHIRGGTSMSCTRHILKATQQKYTKFLAHNCFGQTRDRIISSCTMIFELIFKYLVIGHRYLRTRQMNALLSC